MTTRTTGGDGRGSIGTVRPIKIEEEMRASYLDYAMSVIVARALPDVRDGLKPVQRRILYAISELGLGPTSAYKKSARIVGEVLGKYHPHGDAPVYEAMVRLAQDFSMRYPLVDGQGNFGSVDGDPAAAMRYTEARLAPIAQEMLADIDRDTVNFVPNFDDSLKEPVVLPARLPNLLVNGAAGIAVGMATNIPPHNVSEVCDAIAYLVENPEATVEELTEIVRGPDFPTAGIIYCNLEALRRTYADGHGRVVMRALAHIEEAPRGGRFQVVITELPYQVNKASLVERIADLARSKRIDGIADLRDESDRHGMRIVIDLKREAQARSVLNALYKHTAMQSTFAVNMLALVEGQPRTISLKRALEAYIEHRRVVIRRRSQFDLARARDREHILQGLLMAIERLDEVIQTIRRSPSAEEAKTRLMRRFGLSERQAQAVLEMQLRRLARLERAKLQEEYKEVIQRISYLEDLLANPRKIDYLIKEDTQELKATHGGPRRTRVVAEEVEDLREEDLIAHQEIVVTLSRRGHVKRQQLDTYRLQRRGGRGLTGMPIREEDAVRHLLVCDSHDALLFFTDRGRVFQLKAYEIEDTSRRARGIPLINLISLEQGELVTAVVAVREFEKDYMVLVTRRGEIKKTPLGEFASVRRAGLICMDLEPTDVLVGARAGGEASHVLLFTRKGKGVRYAMREVTAHSRAAGGVRAARLAPGDEIVALAVLDGEGQEVLTVTEKGFGKRTPATDYPAKHRPWAGVVGHELTDKTGALAAARVVEPAHELMLVSRDGYVVRTGVDTIRVCGRVSQGVTVMNVGPGDAVAAIAVIDLARSPAAQSRKEMHSGVRRAAAEEAAKGKPVPRRRGRPKATAKGGATASQGSRRAPAPRGRKGRQP